MFDFLNPYATAIKVGLFAVAALAIVGTLGYLYYEWNSMKATIETQKANIAILDLKAKADDAVIVDLKKNQKIAADLTGQYMAALQASNQQLIALSDKLRKLNVPVAIANDPIKAEKDLNDIFNKTINCLSSATGSSEKCEK